MQNFSLKIRTEKELIVFNLIGTLDAHNISVLEKEFKNQLNQEHYYYVINLSALDYITSAGLGVFMEFIEEIREHKGDIVFCCYSEKIYNIFDLLGFPLIYKFFREEKEAIAYLEEYSHREE